MGIEFEDMEISDLENILHEISRGNTRDMSTFREIMREWYGGIDIRRLQKLENFIRNELGLHSDAELCSMDQQQKLQLIEFLH